MPLCELRLLAVIMVLSLIQIRRDEGKRHYDVRTNPAPGLGSQKKKSTLTELFPVHAWFR